MGKHVPLRRLVLEPAVLATTEYTENCAKAAMFGWLVGTGKARRRLAEWRLTRWAFRAGALDGFSRIPMKTETQIP